MGELEKATPWERKIRATGKLLVYNDISVGRWATVFQLAMETFNKHMKPAGVQLEEATSKGKANVIMKLMKSTAMHGKASIGLRYPQQDVIMEAEFFLPDDPQHSDPSGMVPASVDVMQIIAVHEMIHAAGLANRDHGGDGIFYSPLMQRDGKLYVPVKGRNPTLMPPIRIGNSIIYKVKKLW